MVTSHLKCSHIFLYINPFLGVTVSEGVNFCLHRCPSSQHIAESSLSHRWAAPNVWLSGNRCCLCVARFFMRSFMHPHFWADLSKWTRTYAPDAPSLAGVIFDNETLSINYIPSKLSLGKGMQSSLFDAARLMVLTRSRAGPPLISTCACSTQTLMWSSSLTRNSMLRFEQIHSPICPSNVWFATTFYTSSDKVVNHGATILCVR